MNFRMKKYTVWLLSVLLLVLLISVSRIHVQKKVCDYSDSDCPAHKLFVSIHRDSHIANLRLQWSTDVSWYHYALSWWINIVQTTLTSGTIWRFERCLVSVSNLGFWCRQESYDYSAISDHYGCVDLLFTTAYGSIHDTATWCLVLDYRYVPWAKIYYSFNY